MRLLLIEDDTTYVELLVSELEDGLGATIVLARDRDSALAVARADTHFDLVVCDLRIPASDGNLVPDVMHGQAVVTHVIDTYPGTPIVVLSAYGDVDTVRRLLAQSTSGDPFGDGTQRTLVQYFQKDRLPEFLGEVRRMHSEVAKLEQIEVSSRGRPLDLSAQEERLIRLCARSVGGAVAHVEILQSGLSSARVVKLKVDDPRGAVVMSTVMKLGSLTEIREERDNSERYVAALLPAGTFAPIARHVDTGAGASGAIVYSLAGDGRNLFDYLHEEPIDAALVVSQIAENSLPWHGGAPAQSTTVRDIRESLVLESELADSGVDLDAVVRDSVEEGSVQVRACTQHGDLHGANVLINDSGAPVLIDFALTGPSTASFDSVALELSYLFHPESPRQRSEETGAWPTLTQASSWDDLDRYLVDCPVPDFISACRDWAHSRAAGNREVFSNVYAYSLRQLKYSDTDHELAVAIAARAAELLCP